MARHKRRHHNTTGERQIRRGRTRRSAAYLARTLKITLASGCPGCLDPNGPTEHADWCKAWPKAWR